jgi:orotidine-5'-phosphate decarboxylase
MERDPRDTLVVALDVGGLSEASALVDRLGGEVWWYKVGLELFVSAGPAAVHALKQRGKKVFLDLKLHDIPNTVSRAATQLAELGVDLLDLHVAAGPEAMSMAAAAVKLACGDGPRPRLIGVTVLTSAGSLGPGGQPLTPDALAREVGQRALGAREAGLDGVVCPAGAMAEVRARCGEDFLMLVPGIRPLGSARGDQRWVATPGDAAAAGARWIVVGRPIYSADDPPAAVQEILAEIAARGHESGPRV